PKALSARIGRYPMTESKNRQWILNARPAGKLTGEEFLWNEAPIPRPSDGQVLIRTMWLSIDPAQRIWMVRDSYKPAVPLGTVMQSFAGGPAKCAWLVNEAHFDAAIDYKSEDIGARLSELCPEGIDVFFDNVGGEVLNEVLARINVNARIALCGSISKAGAATPQPGPANYSNLVARRARMEGF